MKKYLFLFSLLSLSLVSCGDDEPCETGTFSENVVGTWKTPSLGDSESGTVTFNADGTGVGSENGLFYSELNGEGSGNFDWSYDSAANAMSVDWNFTNGGLGVAMDVVEFSCDEVTFNFFLDFTMERE